MKIIGFADKDKLPANYEINMQISLGPAFAAESLTRRELVMKLREIAHSRAGDKGQTLNLSLIAFRPEDYPTLEKYVTSERVKAHFSSIVQGEVVRYTLPALGAMNFVLKHALGGGVTCSLKLDAHGKSLSYVLLDMEISGLSKNGRNNKS